VIAGRLVRVTGRIERDGPVTHLIAERVEDLSHLLKLAQVKRRRGYGP
jgi:error-prone DNA polymerase